eukprot:4399977-Prymnesium_polylepis.1
MGQSRRRSGRDRERGAPPSLRAPTLSALRVLSSFVCVTTSDQPRGNPGEIPGSPCLARTMAAPASR